MPTNEQFYNAIDEFERIKGVTRRCLATNKGAINDAVRAIQKGDIETAINLLAVAKQANLTARDTLDGGVPAASPNDEDAAETNDICEICEMLGEEVPAGKDADGKTKAVWATYPEFGEDFLTCDAHWTDDLEKVPGATHVVKGVK